MNNTKGSAEEQGAIFRLKILCVIALSLSLTLLIFWVQACNLISNIDRLVRDNTYVSVSGWDLPTIVVIPCFFGMKIFGGMHRRLDCGFVAQFTKLRRMQQIEGMLEVLLDKASQIIDPFEQSFFMMVHLPYLQPFADINKRTSRLAANLPLFRVNLCPLTFLDVPEQAYSRAILGVYEMPRVELLRDIYVWAYERSTQEDLAIKQDLAEPDPLRLAWRNVIKQTIREVVTQPKLDPLLCIQRAVEEQVPEGEQASVQALIVEELRRLHEGVLARYGLRPSEYIAWKMVHAH